jgi:hypothetical protein
MEWKKLNFSELVFAAEVHQLPNRRHLGDRTISNRSRFMFTLIAEREMRGPLIQNSTSRIMCWL